MTERRMIGPFPLRVAASREGGGVRGERGECRERRTARKSGMSGAATARDRSRAGVRRGGVQRRMPGHATWRRRLRHRLASTATNTTANASTDQSGSVSPRIGG